MRVISGKYARRAIASPAWTGVRPLLSRLRKALFDTLHPFLPYGPFLDLFGGTGAFTLEALSRGAPGATIIDQDPRTVRLIRENLDHAHVSEPVEVKQGDAVHWLQEFARLHRQFQVIAIAPPYYQGLENQILDILDASPDLLAPEGIAFVQYPTHDETIALSRKNLTLWRTRHYGQTLFSYFVSPQSSLLSEDSRHH